MGFALYGLYAASVCSNADGFDAMNDARTLYFYDCKASNAINEFLVSFALLAVLGTCWSIYDDGDYKFWLISTPLYLMALLFISVTQNTYFRSEGKSVMVWITNSLLAVLFSLTILFVSLQCWYAVQLSWPSTSVAF